MPGAMEPKEIPRDEKIRRLRSLLHKKAQIASASRPVASQGGFLRDARLDESIQPCGVAKHVCATSAILLTGGTGFLGAHLLYDLCRLTNATIYCLVRGRGPVDALERVQANLSRYIDYELPGGRVIPVIGDLAQPGLGVSAPSMERLASEIDVIFHNGAVLNHLVPYERLRAANVTSTIELLSLAASRRPKWMYYVSSIIAATERDNEGLLAEQLPAGDPFEITGGYAQSKWVSEFLLGQARQRGFGVTVYRPGIISGRQDSGAWAVAHDHLLLLLKSCYQLGYAAESELILDMTPVDYVSEAIVRLSLTGLHHPVVHLSNPRAVPWTTLVQWMNELGYPLRLVPFDVWQKEHLAQIDESNALFPLLPVYLEESVGERQMLIARLAKVSRSLTGPMLAGIGLEYPVIDKELWRKYARYCHRHGFWPAPLQK